MAAQASDFSHRVSAGPRCAFRIAPIGLWLRDHQRAIRRIQWGVIAIYAALVIVPVFAPEPTRDSHIWTDIVLFAQFAFWGVWWPFVLVSMVLMGRTWCGVFCPEGALTEMVSERGLGRATPHWMKWQGWPFAAFVGTTVYGQMISVYQYPKPVIVILGGSTLAAMAVGLRLWPQQARLVPLSLPGQRRVRPAREAGARPLRGRPRRPGTPGRASKDRRPRSTARRWFPCATCRAVRPATCAAAAPASRTPSRSRRGRLAGNRACQRPDREAWETALIVFGLLGVAPGAFLWSSSPWFVAVKQRLAEWLVAHGMVFLLEPTLPWWILTNYPARNDVLSPLDGALLIGYILATAVVLGVDHCRVPCAGDAGAGSVRGGEGPSPRAESYPDRGLRCIPRFLRNDR